MIDMGIEPFLLSSALIGVVGQRLVRSVCPECRTEYSVTPQMLEPLGMEVPDLRTLIRGRGCAQCYDSGYKGRRSIPRDRRVRRRAPAADRLEPLPATSSTRSSRRGTTVP